MLEYFDVPLPPLWPSEIERAKRARWPEVEPVFDRHKAHIMVSVVLGEEFSRVQLARAVSAAVGAVIDSQPACSAVLWDKTMIHSAAEAADISRVGIRGRSLRRHSSGSTWIRSKTRERPRSGVITVGIEEFIGREIEMEGRDEDWDLCSIRREFSAVFLEEGVRSKTAKRSVILTTKT